MHVHAHACFNAHGSLCVRIFACEDEGDMLHACYMFNCDVCQVISIHVRVCRCLSRQRCMNSSFDIMHIHT